MTNSLWVGSAMFGRKWLSLDGQIRLLSNWRCQQFEISRYTYRYMSTPIAARSSIKKSGLRIMYLLQVTDDSIYERDGAEATKTTKWLHEASDGRVTFYTRTRINVTAAGPSRFVRRKPLGARIITCIRLYIMCVGVFAYKIYWVWWRDYARVVYTRRFRQDQRLLDAACSGGGCLSRF